MATSEFIARGANGLSPSKSSDSSPKIKPEHISARYLSLGIQVDFILGILLHLAFASNSCAPAATAAFKVGQK